MNNNGRKISSKYFLTLIFTALFVSVTLKSPANYSALGRFTKILTYPSDHLSDTIPAGYKPHLPAIDTSNKNRATDTARFVLIKEQIGPTLDTTEFKISKDTMEAAIDYKASDSIVMVIPTRNITLYSKANAKYKDSDLTADVIKYDQDHNIVTASPTRDSAANVIGQPKMVHTDNTQKSDPNTYNIKA